MGDGANLSTHPQRQYRQLRIVDQYALHDDGLIEEEQCLGEPRGEVVARISISCQEFDLHDPSLPLTGL